MEFPGTGSFPAHQQYPVFDPSIQVPYGWQTNCLEMGNDGATNDVQLMPSPMQYQGTIPPVNPVNSMLPYQMPCPPHPQAFPDGQHNKRARGMRRANSWHPNLMNQEPWASVGAENVNHSKPQVERSCGWLHNSKQASFDETLLRSQKHAEVAHPSWMVPEMPQESSAVRAPYANPLPYPVNPGQILYEYPFDSCLEMPSPGSSPSKNRVSLKNIRWSSFDQPTLPSVTEPGLISPDLNPNKMNLNNEPGYLGIGYPEVSGLRFQDVIPASSYSAPPSPHPIFKMGASNESEHQFAQTGMAEMDLPLQAIGFEGMGALHTDLINQCPSDIPFPNPPNICEVAALDPQSQLLPSATTTNWHPQPDVWGKPLVSDFPTSDLGASFQPPNNNFSATYNPGELKGVSLPLADQQVKLVDSPEGSNEEAAALCNLLTMLRAKYPSSETWSNCGLVRSVVTVFPDELFWLWRIPVTIMTDIFPEPVQTSPYAGCTVEELIHTTLPDAGQSFEESRKDYVLKLCDAEEILQNPCTLGSHECLQQYLKLGNDIRLQLLRHDDLQKALARTVGDDQSPSTLQQTETTGNGAGKMSPSRKALSSKLESYHHEAKILLSSQKSTGRVVEEVKAICYMLSSVETKGITEAIKQLQSVVLLQQKLSPHTVQLPDNQGSLTGAINALTAAVSQLVHIYCINFHTDYQVAHVDAIETLPVAQAQMITTPLSFNIYAVHGIPSAWAGSYENLFVSCSLIYGGEELCQRVKTAEISITKPSLFFVARWNQRINMPIDIAQLPCEVLLNLTLRGSRITADATRNSRNAESLASVSMPLYSSNLALVQSSKLLCLDTDQADNLILQIDFPASLLVKFVRPASAANYSCFTDIDEVSRRQITYVQQKHSLLLIDKEEKNLLWTKRSFCNSSNCSLPLLLGSAPNWGSSSLPEIYAVLRRWNLSANPLESLGLLLPSFSDQELRQAAVEQIGTMLDDELLDYLPQLVQAVKFEWHLNNPLVEFLLDRSIRSIRVAHHLYWLLKDGLADSRFKGRYGQLLAAVLCCSGQAMREEFDKETKLIDRLAEIAEKVGAADQSKRSTLLMKEIEKLEKFFYQEHACRLPLNPAFAVKGVDASACSYFTSNAVPLKIAFINADPLGKNINVIYKSGDDLRQDMLVLQMVKVMDRIWCQEGLNMSMIVYRCISTGRGRGLVEMVPGATTLAKIHMKHGIIGPLKEDTLLKWFQEHNPTEDLHKNVVENFVSSCAGWCVATFILGICDRHNDNIMLKTTGHMFHIDFGKILGHAQMIGNVKRDRAPFIFTSEMQHFITEGGRNGVCFQRFVDLSCRAYNIIRQHTQLFMNLLELMLSAGLPELAEVQDLKYVYDKLRPKDSDAQAASYFTSLIKESQKSLPVKINFVAHMVAQMKVAGSNVQPSLSFAPEKHTLQTDALISSAVVCGFEKKMVPRKDYFYKIQVKREGQSEETFIERSFNQFDELNKQLHCCFPASELPRFPCKPLIGLLKGRELARRRKDELNAYVKYLLNGSPQVAKSDLVYTFLHCFPNNEKPSVPLSPEAAPHTGKLSASVQLCISWENSKLSLMVKHVKNIFLPDGSAPDAYVKIYLLPDVVRVTKRKTKMVPKNSNPTYNEILEYAGIPSIDLSRCVIQLSVWCRKTLLGAVDIPLRNVKLDEEKWYRLGNSLI